MRVRACLCVYVCVCVLKGAYIFFTSARTAGYIAVSSIFHDVY